MEPWYQTQELTTPQYTVEPTPREVPRIEISPWYYINDNKNTEASVPITTSAASNEPWYMQAQKQFLLGASTGVAYGFNALKNTNESIDKLTTAATNFGRAASGEYLTPEEEAQTAVTTTATLGMGGITTAPLREGVGIFGGSVARVIEEGYFGQLALERAQKLAERGVSNDDILKATGFFKEKDKWLFEISDNQANLLPKTLRLNQEYALSEVLKHDELFKYYPEFKSIKFEVKTDFGKSLPKTALAYFDRVENKIVVRPSLFKDSEKLVSVMLHEIQHSVQKVEGMQGGSSPLWTKRNALAQINKELEDTFLLMQKTDSSEEYGKLVQKANKLAALEDSVAANIDQFGHYLYERAPGEIQARLVQERMKMSPEERLLISPRAHLEYLQQLEGRRWEPSKFSSPETMQEATMSVIPKQSSEKKLLK